MNWLVFLDCAIAVLSIVCAGGFAGRASSLTPNERGPNALMGTFFIVLAISILYRLVS